MHRHTMSQKYARPPLVVAIVVALSLVGGASGGGAKNGKQPPRNTSLPTISGNATVGGSVSGSAGSWTGPGGSFTYQWLRCDSAGSACGPIDGATATTYALSASDAGATLRFAVTASNQNGTSSATSPATGVVQAAATASGPSNTVPPAVVGTMQAGQSVTASAGRWDGTAPLTYTYGWQRCDATGAGCSTVASGTSYTLTSVDVSDTIRVSVTAQNWVGASSASSAASPVVVAAPTATSTPQPTFPIRATFYYPWFPETWTVNGSHVFYHPTLNYYSTTDLSTQQAHIRAMQYGGMNAAISSWWGPGHYTDVRLKQLMQTTTAMGSPLKWAVYYEKEGYGDPTVSQLASDLAYIRDNLATSQSYLRVGGKFVVFVYNADNNTCDVADRWKQANSQLGSPAYIDLKVFLGYRNCVSQPSSWHQYGPNAPSDEQAGYGFSISPGWWRADQATPVLKRDPVRWASNVAAMVASKEPWQLVTTFNEWTEGTAIESAQEWASPSGYGTYLDALHNAIYGP
jgi:hypothetical protein